MSLLLLILCFHQISGKQFLVELADSSKKDTKSWGGREESQKIFEDKLKKSKVRKKGKIGSDFTTGILNRGSAYVIFFHPT